MINLLLGNTVQYFDSLFSEQFNWRPKLDDLAFDFIDMVEASRLESSFEDSEVLEVVMGMNNDKVPGLMVFLWIFSNPAHDFHASCKFEKSLNAALLFSSRRNPRLLILRTFGLLVL
jgi:hypothetical protein